VKSHFRRFKTKIKEIKYRPLFLQNLKKEFKGYNFRSFQKDLLAGLTVTAVALPLALAFGIGTGATAQAGLITAIIAGFLIGGLAGASFQISGPTGAMVAILLPLVAKHGMEAIFIAGFIAGILLIIAAIFNFGKIISIIPVPVIVGFTSGIALLIFLGQIDNFFGISTPAQESTLKKLLYYFENGSSMPNWWAVGISIVTIVFLFVFPKKWGKFVPAPLLALIVTTAICVIAKLPVATIGEIPRSIFPDSRINFALIDWGLIKTIALPAVSIALLCMIESLLCGEVGSRMKKGEKLNTRQELISQGVGNMIIPFFGGVPATAAIARTSVAIKAGGRTRLVSIIHAIGLLIAIFALAPVMSKIPMSVLAGILIVTAWRMNEWVTIKFMFKKKSVGTLALFFITMIATVAFDLTLAIVIGVAFSCLLFIIQISRNTEIKIVPVDEKDLETKHKMVIKKPLGFIRVVFLTGPIFFSTVHKLTFEAAKLKDVTVIILSMRGVPIIDTSGIMEFYNLIDDLKAHKCSLMLSGVQKPVMAHLQKNGIIDKIGKDMVFWSAEQAISHAQDLEVGLP